MAVIKCKMCGNLNALLKRGNIALEDGEWEKADEFFEQSLNLDAECAEAYFGKALAAGQCHSAEELIKTRRQLGELRRETKTIFQADASRIAAVAEQYQIPGYLDDETILQLFEGFDLTYESVLPAMQERVKAEEDYFGHDRLMGRAMRYAKGEFSDTLQKIKAAICSSLQESLTLAKKEEQKTIRSLANQYAARLDKVEEEITRLRDEAEQKREEDYAGACADMEKARPEQDFICASERRKGNAAKIVMAVAMAAVIAVVILAKERRVPADRFLDLGSDKTAEASPIEESDKCQLALRDRTITRDMISAGFSHTVCLKTDGSVAATGSNNYGQLYIREWTDIVAVSAGAFHTVGVKSDGTVIAKGGDSECGVSDWTDIVAVSAGRGFTIGLQSNGKAVFTGDSDNGRWNMGEWFDLVGVSAGYFHAVGVKSDGTVVATGFNFFGEGDVDEWYKIIAVAAGGNHTVGLKSDGTVVATGNNNERQCNVSDWSDIIAISAGDDFTIGLKSDGTVVFTGAISYGLSKTSDWTDIVAVSAGYRYAIGLKSDGTVVAAGDNSKHQCDVRDWKDIKLPENQTEDLPLPEKNKDMQKKACNF